MADDLPPDMYADLARLLNPYLSPPLSAEMIAWINAVQAIAEASAVIVGLPAPVLPPESTP
jgi:hypothetical protein